MSDIRTIFVSDLHLGCRYSMSEQFYGFIKDKHPEYFVIVGDFIDSFEMNSRWQVDQYFWLIIHRLIEMSMNGTKIVFCVGNHECMDAFPRGSIFWGGLDFRDEYIHELANGKKLLCIHGHQFDMVISSKFGENLTQIGSGIYEWLLWINHGVNKITKKMGFRVPISKSIKALSKKAVNYVNSFEEFVEEHAKSYKVDGVVWGHLHKPQLKNNGFINGNTGCWLNDGKGSAIIEYNDGSLVLVEI